MIEELLPESVVTVETHGDDQDWDAPLYPGEQEFVARSVEKRRREFAAVRACARRAMEKLGVPAQAVPRGEHGAPVWPAGLIGSMTHCEGYCAASLVRATDLASLGIDAETHEELPDDVIVSVALPTENDRLRELARQDASVHWDRLLFSAKESVYKAWYPLTGKWLDFFEADIELFADDGPARSGVLRAELLVPGPLVNGRRIQSFEGRWTVRRGLLATAVTVPHTGADA
ncbi:4'-phosphopantetheinyl transferase family protein [Streptomyces olivochromogenes]|uniref:4'-phosphopantetheinyl transferase n=1 Tax=Streptomyces olivochromogenes TaxID=1963 RepID=A0A250V483_STROL|nr:4'-phosphopantetheinyl transferase superfamily protein [Streptomyces olivochromogenes]KUN48829.1 4'-phosphopantetheinyl transferase [Streptomyces olivochromogenes]GAX48929.1 4'-phosphopantetheinyl transferase [Streptomyces olivochromogenes]